MVRNGRYATDTHGRILPGAPRRDVSREGDTPSGVTRPLFPLINDDLDWEAGQLCCGFPPRQGVELVDAEPKPVYPSSPRMSQSSGPSFKIDTEYPGLRRQLGMYLGGALIAVAGVALGAYDLIVNRRFGCGSAHRR